MGMYGNVSFYQPHTKFNISKTYTSRAAMTQDIEEIVPFDNSWSDQKKKEWEAQLNAIDSLVNSKAYVLVDYSFDNKYTTNHAKDVTKFGNESNFDLTVWQVRMVNDSPRCIAIARMHSVLPTFQVCGSYSFDILPAVSDGDYFGQIKNNHI